MTPICDRHLQKVDRMYMRINNQGRKSRFSILEKEQILRDHRDNGTSISQLARINSIQAVTIYQWKRNFNMTQDSDDGKFQDIWG